jgi:hypothetical protein
MEPMVKSEPQSVLAFNRFVSMTKDVMREFNFEIMAVFKIENGLKDLFPKYMQFVEQNINTSFDQMQHGPQGFQAQENQIVEQFVSTQSSSVTFSTSLVDDVYAYISQFAESVSA